jgi:hypothetical protein
MNKDEELCEKKCQEAVNAAIEILKDISFGNEVELITNVQTILSAYAKIKEITKGEYVEAMHILCSAFGAVIHDAYDEIHPYSVGGYQLVVLLKAAMVLSAADRLDDEISYIKDDYLVNFNINKEIIDVVSKNIT